MLSYMTLLCDLLCDVPTSVPNALASFSPGDITLVLLLLTNRHSFMMYDNVMHNNVTKQSDVFAVGVHPFSHRTPFSRLITLNPLPVKLNPFLYV